MRRITMWLAAAILAVAIGWGAASPAAADGQWQDTTDAVVALLEGVPAQHAAGDVKAAEAAIRKAYYEEYQASGLEDEIKHRLGAERSTAFQQGVVDLRNLAREGTEADGLEKATLSYLSNGRMAKVERAFRDLRVGIRDGAPVEEVRAHVDALGQMVTEDAAALDALGASESVGWSGFVAAFLILLREGVEALLVVAAVVTYVIKTGRRDQLRGVYLGIGAAVLVSVGLAVAFNSMTSSGALGLTQELIEGVVGFLAVAMLIYISSWILSKSEGDAWHRYINATIDKKATSGGQWALFTVVFLAVAREGFETILFFVLESTPIDGLPQIEWLGIYQTVETLVAQGIVAAVVVALGLWQRAKAKANTPELSDSHAHS